MLGIHADLTFNFSHIVTKIRLNGKYLCTCLVCTSAFDEVLAMICDEQHRGVYSHVAEVSVRAQ